MRHIAGVCVTWPTLTHMDTRTDTRTWRLMPEAAALLGISVRTLERHVAKGRYTLMHDPEGRRLVDVGDAAPAEAVLVQEVRQAGEDARHQSQVLTVALERVTAQHEHALARLASDLEAARQQEAQARQATEQARRVGRWGWMAAASGLAACAALGATLTHTLLGAQEQGATLRRLRDNLTQVEVRAAAAEAAAEAARASEAATRREALTHTRSWWWLAPSQARASGE